MTKTGMHRLIGRISRGAAIPPIIGYHRVVEDFSASAETFIPSLLISIKMLEQHLDWLGRRYHFVDLNEIGSRIENGDIGRSIAITFDDGYRDFYELAFPLLQRKGIPSALFVVTNLPDTNQVQTHDLLYQLLRRFPGGLRKIISAVPLPALNGPGAFESTRACIEALSGAELAKLIADLSTSDPEARETLGDSVSVTWEQIARMRRAGVTIGSHTRSHVLLPNESESTAREEALISRRELQERLQIPINHFAYPSGAFDDASVLAVAAAGYKYAFGTCRHRDTALPMLSIPRTLLWERSCLDSDGRFSGPVLECLIEGAFDSVTGCRQVHRRQGSANEPVICGAAA